MNEEWFGRTVVFGNKYDDTGEGHFDPRCSSCGRFYKVLNSAEMVVNGVGEIKSITGIVCSKCGSIQPDLIEWI